VILDDSQLSEIKVSFSPRKEGRSNWLVDEEERESPRLVPKLCGGGRGEPWLKPMIQCAIVSNQPYEGKEDRTAWKGGMAWCDGVREHRKERARARHETGFRGP